MDGATHALEGPMQYRHCNSGLYYIGGSGVYHTTTYTNHTQVNVVRAPVLEKCALFKDRFYLTNFFRTSLSKWLCDFERFALLLVYCFSFFRWNFTVWELVLPLSNSATYNFEPISGSVVMHHNMRLAENSRSPALSRHDRDINDRQNSSRLKPSIWYIFPYKTQNPKLQYTYIYICKYKHIWYVWSSGIVLKQIISDGVMQDLFVIRGFTLILRIVWYHLKRDVHSPPNRTVD